MVAISGLAILLNPCPLQHLFFGPLRFSESLSRLHLFLSLLYQSSASGGTSCHSILNACYLLLTLMWSISLRTGIT